MSETSPPLTDEQWRDAFEPLMTVVDGSRHPPVVIHDAEVLDYATAIDELAINYSIFPTDPDTAVVWS